MLTLEQLIDLGNNINIDIFDGLTLPEGSPLDREIFINSIIMKCGLNIPMYADPKVMASAINVWSAKNQYTFEHVAKIYTAEYSPIENKNYYSEHSLKRDLTDDTKTDGKKKETIGQDGSSTITQNKTTAHTGTDSTTEEMETSAYNESSYQDKDKTTTELSHGETITENGGGKTLNKATIDKESNSNGSANKIVNEGIKEDTHEHGNIGVSTNTMLQSEEYELLSKFRPYDFLAGLFENELTLYIY